MQRWDRPRPSSSTPSLSRALSSPPRRLRCGRASRLWGRLLPEGQEREGGGDGRGRPLGQGPDQWHCNSLPHRGPSIGMLGEEARSGGSVRVRRRTRGIVGGVRDALHLAARHGPEQKRACSRLASNARPQAAHSRRIVGTAWPTTPGAALLVLRPEAPHHHPHHESPPSEDTYRPRTIDFRSMRISGLPPRGGTPFYRLEGAMRWERGGLDPYRTRTGQG
jgi:hypothetical protein